MPRGFLPPFALTFLLLAALFSPNWISFCREFSGVAAGNPSARDAVDRAILSGYAERGYHVTRQARDLGYEVADNNHKIVRWRLLVPAVARVLHLPDWATLGLAHLGCVGLIFYLTALGRSLAPSAPAAAVFGFCLTAGATAPFFTSMGWLGYYDSLLALALLAVAFAPSRLAVLAACVLGPWIDERFVIGLPLSLLVRFAAAPPVPLRDWLRREALAPLSLALAYGLFRLGLGGSGGSQTTGEYLSQFVLGQPLPALQRLTGAWAGLRLGWVLVTLALIAAFRPASGLRSGLGTALALTSLLTALLALHTALDLSRSTVLLLPLLPLGWLAASRLLPPTLLTTCSLGLALLSLALPAHHVFGRVVLRVDSFGAPSLPLKNAYHRLGMMYAHGEAGSRDTGKAVRWYRKAADLGYAAAQNNLGALLAAGEGVTRDEFEAARLYELAIAQGNSSALTNLAILHERGASFPRDPSKAIELYRKAAELGDAAAQVNLGLMRARGEFVPRDPAEAVRLYRLAALQGVAIAQMNLAIMYAAGDGVARDERAAFLWMNRAALQGVALAQKNLAVFHERGIGTPPDQAEALRWFRRAAAKGDAEARVNLGARHANGDGVTRDLVRGLAWTALAAAQGDPQAVQNLPRLAFLATAAERTSAESLANRWAREGAPDENLP